MADDTLEARDTPWVNLPGECETCGHEQRIVKAFDDLPGVASVQCEVCGDLVTYSGNEWLFNLLVKD